MTPLEDRLAEAEATIAALIAGQIDAVLEGETNKPVLLVTAQAALRESEARYRGIVETANEGILTIDSLSRVTFVNRRVSEILGFSESEMLGRSLFRFVSASAAMLAALRLERSSQGISEAYEVSFRRSDGGELWALLKTSPILDHNGSTIGTLAMFTDRTRAFKDEEALRRDEEQHRQIVELSPDGVLKVDASGAIVFANPRFAKMLGCEPRALIGGNVLDLISDGARATAGAWLNVSERVKAPVACAFRHDDGSEVAVSIMSVPLVDGDGHYVATLATVRTG